MRDDLQHLNQLSIFYYVLAALLGVLTCSLIVHLIMGIVMINSPSAFPANPGLPPQPWLGWFLVLGVSVFMVFGWTLTILMAMAGRFLKQRTHYRFCFVVAILSCLYTPLGTVLGIFTILVLVRPSVKDLFGASGAVNVEPA